MTGPTKPGLYRYVDSELGRYRFYRVHPNDEGIMVAVELVHEDNMAVEVKDSKQPIDQSLWEKLQFWQ